MKTTRLIQKTHLFWDISPQRIEETIARYPEWTMARVLHYGEIEDILDAVDLFGKEKLKEVIDTQPLRRMAYGLAIFIYKEYEPKTNVALRDN